MLSEDQSNCSKHTLVVIVCCIHVKLMMMSSISFSSKILIFSMASVKDIFKLLKKKKKTDKTSEWFTIIAKYSTYYENCRPPEKSQTFLVDVAHLGEGNSYFKFVQSCIICSRKILWQWPLTAKALKLSLAFF